MAPRMLLPCPISYAGPVALKQQAKMSQYLGTCAPERFAQGMAAMWWFPCLQMFRKQGHCKTQRASKCDPNLRGCAGFWSIQMREISGCGSRMGNCRFWLEDVYCSQAAPTAPIAREMPGVRNHQQHPVSSWGGGRKRATDLHPEPQLGPLSTWPQDAQGQEERCASKM